MVQKDLRLQSRLFFQLGESLEAVSDLTARVSTAQQNDITWIIAILNNSSTNCQVPEWSGFMMRDAVSKAEHSGCATSFIFGPLIEAPQGHPDTVLSTLIFRRVS